MISMISGAVVHSGERLICIQEVRGSNPLGSILFTFSTTFTLRMCYFHYKAIVDEL